MGFPRPPARGRAGGVSGVHAPGRARQARRRRPLGRARPGVAVRDRHAPPQPPPSTPGPGEHFPPKLLRFRGLRALTSDLLLPECIAQAAAASISAAADEDELAQQLVARLQGADAEAGDGTEAEEQVAELGAVAAAARERPEARVPALLRALGLSATLADLAAASGHADLQVRPGLALLARRVEGDKFPPKLRGRGLLTGNSNGPWAGASA